MEEEEERSRNVAQWTQFGTTKTPTSALQRVLGKIKKSNFAFQREKREKSLCFQPLPLKPGPPKGPKD